ncbi:putative zinc transporter ZIP1-like [Apostichopus japonicus]|uniref:Putative zinc transporter ZIP1-like n=1 Tax=Stichopus japonicus TaxID=307972 RepID=A0A2G8KJF6_STIJA|nr:putative zinc transporter ZIP1-like [Apostichopus japonicus]
MGVDVHDFPVAEVSVAIGLLLILIIEQTFLMLQLRFYNDPDGKQTTEERVEEDVGADETDILLSSSYRTRSATVATEWSPRTEAVTNEVDEDVMHGTRKSAAFRSLLLLSALSFHSILEGIAIGINTHARDVLTLCLGISIHKSVIAFSLSINFLLTMRKWNAFLCLTTFALMSPIGTVCGIYIESAIEGTIWGGILQGLATGTFLYITFFELLNHEIESHNDKLMKILAILLGFGIICALIAFQNFYLNAPT